VKRAGRARVHRGVASTAAARLSGWGDDEPLALLHFGFRAVVKKPDEELARRGLGRVHHRILFFIARSPGLGTSELLSTLEVSKQALHAPLRRLERERLVQSLRDPGDLRQRRLTLTPRGRALERRLSGYQRALFAAAFRSVGPADARGFGAVMRALVAFDSLPPGALDAAKFRRVPAQRAGGP
jgi:DNA-binding MarR family transcriptional regulator